MNITDASCRLAAHPHAAVEPGHGHGGAVGLVQPYASLAVYDLAVQVAELHSVMVHQAQPANASCGEVQSRRRACTMQYRNCSCKCFGSLKNLIFICQRRFVTWGAPWVDMPTWAAPVAVWRAAAGAPGQTF